MTERLLEGILEAPTLGRETLRVDAITAARDLLGAVLVSTVGGRVTAGRITETEAYFGPNDPASHAAERIGRTARNTPMFGEAGTAYVYRIYGIHRCVNVVTDEVGMPSAVLVRALEPVAGIEAMTERRGRATDLCSGPGRLAAALGVDECFNGHPLQEAPLTLRQGTVIPESRVRVTGRVGVTRADDWPLRFFIDGSPASRSARPKPGRQTKDFLEALARHRAHQTR